MSRASVNQNSTTIPVLDPARTTAQEPVMLSSKAKYAVRAARLLAERSHGDGWTQAAEIAEKEVIPRKFLEIILAQLRDHGLLESRRGAQGGYRLLRDPGVISVADIIRIVDGPLALTPCASRTRFRQCSDCVDIRKCRLQHLMQQARDAVADVLENCSLAELATRQPAGKSRRSAARKAGAGSPPARGHTKVPPKGRESAARHRQSL
jgi:Rrf2 family protein